MSRKVATVLALLLVLLLVAGACSKSKATNPQASTGPIKTQAVAVSVKLIEAGKEPRKALLFKLTKGSVATTTMSMDFDLKLESNGQAVPTAEVPATIVTMHTEVVDVTSDRAEVDFSYKDIRLGEGGDAAAATALKNALKQLVGVKGRLTVDDHGRALAFGVQAPSSADAQLKQVLDQISQQASNLAIPFPDEPVGEGARWRVTTSLNLQGIKASYNLTYVLKDVTADVVHLTTIVDESIPEQNANIPGVPAGVTALVRPSHLKGSGDALVDLAQILPRSAEQRGNGAITIDVTQGTETRRFTETVGVHITIESKPG